MRASRTSGFARFARLSAPLQGALLMVGASAGFSLMNGLIRHGSEALDPLQIAFFRNFFALIFLLPWMYRIGISGLRRGSLRLYASRAGIGYLSMVCWFTSLALLPLAEAVSLTFTAPLFATALAALFMGEVVGFRRWTATVVGFLGVLVIVRPGMAPISWVMGLPMLAALFMAVSTLMIKVLSRSEDSRTIVLFLNLFLVPLSLIPALFVWQWPDLWTMGVMVGVGLLSVVAQLMLTMAFARTDASFAIPFMYLQLPFVAGIGFVAFAEIPDIWTLVGALIIAASAIYIARREARLAAKQRAEPPPGRLL